MYTKTLEHIKQEHGNTCAIACAAMVANVTYETALYQHMAYNCIHVNEMCEIQPLSLRQLDKLLIQLDVTPVHSEHEVYGEILPDNVYILAIPPKANTVGHCIVLDTRVTPYKIYDPLLEEETTPIVPHTWTSVIRII